MRLSELLSLASISPTDGPFSALAVGLDPEIRSVHYRSQSVTPGGVFVAITGHQTDGHAFADDAVARGAVAVVSERVLDVGVPCVCVTNSRQALARISAGFYRHPSRDLSVVGVTGTNGKTTTTFLVESMLVCSGKSPGVIGTVNYRYAGKTFENPVTTPESLDLQRIFFDMIRSGVTQGVMEVSSHAIDLNRVDDCAFDVAAFTNLTQDHLDYHGTIEAYWRCKQRLFTEHLVSGVKKDRAVAVINLGNSHGRELFTFLRATFPDLSLLSYGIEGDDLRVYPARFEQDNRGIRGRIVTPVGDFGFESGLVGRHNLENILCATGIGLALGLPLGAVRDGIRFLTKVPGRLEPVSDPTGRFIFVDYAHTPDALENVLKALNALKQTGRLVCVFGCGGDRDRTKRPLMGRIATGLADVTIVTSDNPRTEVPGQIIDDIVSGIQSEKIRRLAVSALAAGGRADGYLVSADRKEAIRLGLMACRPGDMLLIAGKGHETYQILGKLKVSFDDRAETIAALSELQ